MESKQEDGAAIAHETPVAGAGARLRAAREALRLDLAHIAAETRIPLRHLEAIEEGSFETLPSRAYAIGFSRTFAKAVGLDAAEITDIVRAELADGSQRLSAPSSAMEPGDPARLPSQGLAWAAAVAALLLMVGVFAFYNSYFGAGTEPGSLLTPAQQVSATPVAAPTPAAASAAQSSGPVLLTAIEPDVWLRLYEEGGERLVERTLEEGETVTVPATAADPRINTGRPDALAITIGGQSVAKLSERPITISGVPVSATALLARAEPAAAAAAPNTVTATPTARPGARRALSARTNRAEAPAAEAQSDPASATAGSEPTPPPASSDAAQE